MKSYSHHNIWYMCYIYIWYYKKGVVMESYIIHLRWLFFSSAGKAREAAIMMSMITFWSMSSSWFSKTLSLHSLHIAVNKNQYTAVNYAKSLVLIAELIYIKHENHACMSFTKVRTCSHHESTKTNYIKYVLLVS